MSSSAEHCHLVIPLLRQREGQETIVFLSNARTLRIFNAVWGQDLGEDFEHITSNISPNVDGATIDFFFTDEIASIVDPVTGKQLWKANGTPNIR